MNQKSKLTKSQWIELLAREELPAITSIASVLDKFSNDDKSSIPKLSQVILHDQALSSCLLRVANSVYRSPVHKVTTVSRAATVLGIRTVKNICITSKILDGMLKSKNLVPEVYERLMGLMANAFYAGLLARIMVPNYDDDTQEEVYLAAMLYHIGETAFWSTGRDYTKQLIKHAKQPADKFHAYCESVVGFKFSDLTIGLAQTWNLGELLTKALNQPENRTTEMRIISLANQLAQSIASPASNRAKFDQAMKEVGEIMGMQNRRLRRHIEGTRKMAIDLLASYGATALQSYIKPLPNADDFDAAPDLLELIKPSSEKQLLLAIQELTRLTRNKAGMQELIAYVLQTSSKIWGFERCSLWMFTTDGRQLESKSAFDSNGRVISFTQPIPVGSTSNVASLCLNRDKSVLLNAAGQQQFASFVTHDIQPLLRDGEAAFTPVKAGTQQMGLISVQMLENGKSIDEDGFQQFTMLTDQLNLCLSLVV